MPEWKKSIFINAVKLRYAVGDGTHEDIINTYTKLTSEEKVEIIEALQGVG